MSVTRILEFLRFCIVGFVGFLTDAVMLEIFVACDVPTRIARLFSMALALQVGYVLHQIFTFRGRGGFSTRRWLHFLALNLVGVAINYSIFLAGLALFPISDAQMQRQAALVAGTSVALAFNYWANGRFVFAKRDEP